MSVFDGASLCVKARDTGRVALVQRNIDHPHKHAAGLWEFPGGRMDGEHPDEVPLDTAKREWTEEFGAPLPAGSLIGSWQSADGSWVTFVWLIDEETAPGPMDSDDPEMSARAWWDQRLLPGNPAVRLELQDSDWTMIARAEHSLAAQQRDDGHAYTVRKKIKVKQVDDDEAMCFGFDIDGTITEAVEQYREIARGLQALGHEVLVVTARPDAKDFLAQVGFEYDTLIVVDRNKHVGDEKARVLKDEGADFMFENRLKSGPAIAEVCPVTMQFNPVTDDPDKRLQSLPPHLRRLVRFTEMEARKKKTNVLLEDVLDSLDEIIELLQAKKQLKVVNGVVEPHTPTADTVGLSEPQAVLDMLASGRSHLPPHLKRLPVQQSMPDVNRHGEQMCCKDGLTADQHRHDSADGRCCTDIPPSED